MKQKIRLTESDMRRIVRKSVDRIMNEGNGSDINKFSPASQYFVEEDEVLVTDKELFGDNEEHAYDMRCHDGWAEGTPSNDEEGLPARIRMTYPKRDEVLADKKLAHYVLKYRGLYDLDFDDITYGDIMMALGEVDKTDEYKPEKSPLTDLSKSLSDMIMPPRGYGMHESRNMKRSIKLTESDFRRIVKESVRRILKESADEFEYSDSKDLGRGRHRQVIIYNGKEIGYLFEIEKNWLAPIEERYVLPDIEYGMQPDDGGALLDGKKGWIDFKVFDNYEEAFAYAKQNFQEIAYLFEYGDYD